MTIEAPFFFVIGAPRSGTTSLYTWFDKHPEVFVPRIKEPHYFSYPEVADTYYQVPFVAGSEEYEALYSARPDGMLASDFSTSYLYRAEAAERIAAVLPDAKVLAILRNPVERAISHYQLDVRDGYTTAPLAELLSDDHPDGRFRREYVDVGRYNTSIDRWEQVFPAAQLKFVFYEDLTTDWERTTVAIAEFLEIDCLGVPEEQFRNASTGPRRRATRLLAGVPQARQVADRLPPSLRQQLLARFSQPPARVAPETVRHLAELFSPDVEALEKRFCRDLSHWRS